MFWFGLPCSCPLSFFDLFLFDLKSQRGKYMYAQSYSCCLPVFSTGTIWRALSLCSCPSHLSGTICMTICHAITRVFSLILYLTTFGCIWFVLVIVTGLCLICPYTFPPAQSHRGTLVSTCALQYPLVLTARFLPVVRLSRFAQWNHRS